MPTYQYACTACDDRTEAVQKFSDEPLTECAVCGGRLRKVFSAVGVVFKGSGFYHTDSRADGQQGQQNGSRSDSSDKGESGQQDGGQGSSSGSGESSGASAGADSSSGSSAGESGGSSSSDNGSGSSGSDSDKKAKSTEKAA